MPLRTFVKVSNISNLSDARYCAGMGVDLLGFGVIESEGHYIKPSQFQEIRGWVAGPQIVAELYGIKDPAGLSSILDDYKPDYLEMGLKELSLFKSLPLPLILSVDSKDILENLPVEPAYLICSAQIRTSIPLLLSVESKTAVEALLKNSAVKGIVLKGGAEVKPGLKDYEVIGEILELLETE